jgi:hypothetical protein
MIDTLLHVGRNDTERTAVIKLYDLLSRLENSLACSHFQLPHRCTRGEGGTSCTPSEDFKKFGHKNETEHESRGLLRFSQNPQYPPQKNLKTTVHIRLTNYTFVEVK